MIKNITLKSVGYFLIVAGMFIFFLSLYLTTKIMNINDNACASSCSGEMPFCPYKHEVPLESIVLFLFSFALVGVGIYLSVIFEKVSQKYVEEKEKKDYSKVMKTLGEDEKKVLEILIERKGIYQSELKEITGFSKVKITRILDKLESREVVERRRRGLTNFIILK